jgi:hypothetical protein
MREQHLASGCRLTVIAASVMFALGACSQPSGEGSAQSVANGGTMGSAGAGSGYQVPRTAWGDPDLQGKWPGTHMVGVPMQRPERFGERNWLTEEEFQERQAQFERQQELDLAPFSIDDADNVPGGAVGGPVSPPPHWLERGEPQYQASLIIDPPNGRMPAFTEQSVERQRAMQAARALRGPADSFTDRSLYDRCITRGLVGSILPVIYNNGNQIVQAPDHVAIVNEMIHETRIVWLDGRETLDPAIRQYMGDSRGYWDADTLVVVTTNMTDRTGIGANGGGARHSEALTITERFTRTSDTDLLYRVTIDDPLTWVQPWTMELPLVRDDEYGMYEYACHEGNYAMANILSGHRADERAAREAAGSN